MKPFLLSLAMIAVACGGAADEAPNSEGDVSIALTPSEPVHRGTNAFSLKTTDDANNVSVTVWMPSMGHGAPNEPRVVRENDSTYRLDDVVFSMPGTWELKVNVTCPSRSGARAFRFEVP